VPDHPGEFDNETHTAADGSNGRRSITANRPQLLFFFAPRSGRDRRVEGYLAQVLQRRRNHDTFAVRRVDVEKRPELVDRFRLAETPTLLVVDGGRVRVRLTAPTGCTEIATALAPWLK
jgi:hypothetical protein